MSLADITSNLRAPIETRVDSKPTVKVHSVEWRKVRPPARHRGRAAEGGAAAPARPPDCNADAEQSRAGLRSG